MYSHAVTYPSLRADRARPSVGGRRFGAPTRRHRAHFFSRMTTQHVRSQSRGLGEVVRIALALANVAAWLALVLLLAGG